MNDINRLMLKAAQAGDLAGVDRLVGQGADINFTDEYGNFAMFTAAWEGNVDALNLYHSLGANISYEQANLLCNAAYNGKVESVKWMLQHGADANFAFSDTGENGLHYTICKTSENSERVEIVKILVESGTDVNKTTNAGKSTLCFMRDAYCKAETPLHRAAAFGDKLIVKMLIDAGADPSLKDANGDTPMSWGSWYLRDSDVLRLLVYKGGPTIH